ncbi:MAG: CRISPR-associated ring nuclease Csm6 [Candidatus Zhuqueibacterota bacterium]
MDQPKKHILLSLLGKTPQIFTETLYALMIQKHIPVEDIVIITTDECFEVLSEKLLNFKTGKYYEFCMEWKIDYRSINFGFDSILVAPSVPSDIDNIAEINLPLMNVMLHTLKKLTSFPDTVLHCSLAGGRKTMSVYFAYALQFFGRPQDKLYHILVTPEQFENHPDFYYIPQAHFNLLTVNGKIISTSLARISLIEIPYVRLKKTIPILFGEEDFNFSEMVRITQADLEQMPTLFPLILNTLKKTIKIGDKIIHFSPIEMAFYRYYAERSKHRDEKLCVKAYELYFEKAEGEWFPLNSTKQVLLYYREIASSSAVERFIDTLENGYLSFNRVCQYLSRIRKKIYTALNDDERAGYYSVSSIGQYRKSYGIKLDKTKIHIFE